MSSIRLRELESLLNRVPTFTHPILSLEQYVTPPDLAARLLHVAVSTFGEIRGDVVCDLGCGTGRLSVGACLLGAEQVVGLELDEHALEVAKTVREDFSLDEQWDLLRADVFANVPRSAVIVEDGGRRGDRRPFRGHRKKGRGRKGRRGHREELNEVSSTRFQVASRIHSDRPFLPIAPRSCDVVVMNPPFGTKQKGADMVFLRRALEITRRSVYSLHKTSTREHIMKTAERLGVEVEVLAELRYNVEASFSFHKHSSKDIEVDLLRFEVKGSLPKISTEEESELDDIGDDEDSEGEIEEEEDESVDLK